MHKNNESTRCGTGRRWVAPLTLTLVMLVGLDGGAAFAGGSPSKDTAESDAGGDAKEGGNKPGFSIESEMLTYRALQSNSEAIACDVAAYVNGTAPTFGNTAPGAVCSAQSHASAPSGVILASFDGSVFEGFQFWRAEMEVMREIQTRVRPYCSGSGALAIESRGSESSKGSALAGVAKSAAKLTPFGSALELSQTLLGALKTIPSSAPVVGTIEDQAFIDGVGRALRVLNVSVIAPSAFPPFSLAPIDTSRSPFVTGLNHLLDARTCLEEREAGSDLDAQDRLRVHEAIVEIDAYVSVFRGTPASAANSAGTEAGAAHSQPQHGGGAAGAQATTAPLAADVAPLMSMLTGDNLARKLGVDPATGLLPASTPWQHVLLVKALESGGTIAGKGNIFGSKTSYSGGSVGTFALFSMDGTLECSGNVYEFGGSVSAETFEHDLRTYKPDPQSQLLFQRGSCLKPQSPQ